MLILVLDVITGPGRSPCAGVITGPGRSLCAGVIVPVAGSESHYTVLTGGCCWGKHTGVK